MKFRYLAPVAAALTFGSFAAQAEGVQEDIYFLSYLVDEQLCIEGREGYFCSEDKEVVLVGAFGRSDDLMQPASKSDRQRERVNKKYDLSCDEYAHPIEDPHCNYTTSKAEWRHDSLRLKLESADQAYDQGKDPAGAIYLCTFASDIYSMRDAGAITPEGYTAIVNNGERDLAAILYDAEIATVPADDGGILCDE